MNARVLSVASALPSRRYSQEELRELAPRLFQRRLPGAARRFFSRSGVEARYFSLTPERVSRGLSAKERAALYVEHALDLSEQAAKRALEKANLTPADVGRLVVTSTTGEPTPSLDTRLQLRMGFPLDHCRPRSHRGHGCASGAEELGEAADSCKHHPGRGNSRCGRRAMFLTLATQ